MSQISARDVEGNLPPIDNHVVTNIQLVYKGGKYVANRQLRLRNDLLFVVGYLEFFNALDFPANVWNNIPIPTFAKALMITGGSIALLASLTAFWDFQKSYRNVTLLRQERSFLQHELESAKFDGLKHRQIYLLAWLNHNFRELGWEIIDRLCMDAFAGFAAVLVGTGTIMAIGGANPKIYLASNLLSGYIGNGFIAFYGFFNCMWSVYAFLRARKHKKIVQRRIRDKSIRERGVHIFRNHQKYVIVDGVAMIVASAGSLVSSTLWYGYVLLIPCIAVSVYCNYLWRKKVGYTRVLSQFKSSCDLMPDVHQQILDAVNTQTSIKAKTLDKELAELHQEALLQQIMRYELYDELCMRLVNDPSTARIMDIDPADKIVNIKLQDVEIVETGSLLKAVQDCFGAKKGFQHVLDRERMLFEYLGSYVTFENQVSQSGETSDTEEAEKMPFEVLNQITPVPDPGPSQDRASSGESQSQTELGHKQEKESEPI